MEQNKRRYQARVRRLEQRIVEMSFGADKKFSEEKCITNDNCIGPDNFTNNTKAQQPQRLKSKNSEELSQTYESQLQIQDIVPETTL